MAHPLRQYRDRKGISAKDFSKLLNLSRQSLHRIEIGCQTPSGDLLRRIHDLTCGEVSPNDVLLASRSREDTAIPRGKNGRGAASGHENSASALSPGAAR